MAHIFLQKLKLAIIKFLCFTLIFLVPLISFGQSLLLEPTIFKAQFKSNSTPILIDLRAFSFFNNGHISKAINIPYDNPDFEKAIAYLSKESPLFLYCQNGENSKNAAIFMNDLGFKQVLVLKGGFENWVKTPLPYVSSQKFEPLAYFSIADIEKLTQKYPLVLIDFYATWCKPCKQQDPILKDLNEKYPNLKIIKIDADKNQTASSHFEIEEIPTLILFKKNKQIWRKSGLVKAKQLEAVL